MLFDLFEPFHLVRTKLAWSKFYAFFSAKKIHMLMLLYTTVACLFLLACATQFKGIHICSDLLFLAVLSVCFCCIVLLILLISIVHFLLLQNFRT